jgi:hypothetical protein
VGNGQVPPGAGLGEGAFAVEKLADVRHGVIFPYGAYP